jgi:hypothetical protein
VRYYVAGVIIGSFRLEKNAANKIIADVAKAVSKWRDVAKSFDLTKK